MIKKGFSFNFINWIHRLNQIILKHPIHYTGWYQSACSLHSLYIQNELLSPIGGQKKG
jgi:hypothetical protein